MVNSQLPQASSLEYGEREGTIEAPTILVQALVQEIEECGSIVAKFDDDYYGQLSKSDFLTYASFADAVEVFPHESDDNMLAAHVLS